MNSLQCSPREWNEWRNVILYTNFAVGLRTRLYAKQEIIVIGDVHREHRWKDIVEKHPGGRFVFLGDYCDPYDKNVPDNEVVENLKQIMHILGSSQNCIIFTTQKECIN